MAVETGVINAGMLLNIPQRPPELGRIRLGEKGARGEPVRLKTFRLTSGSKALLEAAANLYGGRVQAWPGAPDEGTWQLTTAVAELDILIPTNLRSVSQAYELWKGGTCERRCDGVNVSTPKGPESCICAVKKLEGPERECEIMTRLSVMLPRVPGLGVWRLDTGGWMAATTLPSTLTLLANLARGSWMSAVLRAEQRSKKERQPDGKVQTHRFVVPVLDLPGTTLAQLVDGAGFAPMPQIEGGERPQPPTARERVAQRVQAARATAPNETEWGGIAVRTDEPADSGTEAAREGVEATEEAVVVEGSGVTERTAPEPVPCDSTSPFDGAVQCVREAGHVGTHKAENESWPNPK